MSFFRKKLINGHEYWYEVENFREGNKVRQKVLKYIGKKKPKKGLISKKTRKHNYREDELYDEIEKHFGGLIKVVRNPAKFRKVKKYNLRLKKKGEKKHEHNR